VETRTLRYLGEQLDWREDSHFARVRYRSIYKGIDLVFVSNSGQLEYTFELEPHADPQVIRVRSYGAACSLTRDGNWTIRTPGVEIVQLHPLAFQPSKDLERPVACRYVVRGKHEVMLEMGNYDRNRPLTIDPTLTFSTFVGGSGLDAIFGMTTDLSGNVYIACERSSGSLWSSAVAGQSSRDAFVAKLNSTGTTVLYTVYLGGSGNDAARAIAVDLQGNVHVAGVTQSTDFPVTSGAFSVSAPGPASAFVAKLDTFGRLVYSTYLGAVVAGSTAAVATDSSGAAYLAGQTDSPSLPLTGGAVQGTYQGGQSDCFISKLNAARHCLSVLDISGRIGT
jgi:Beta-propeller repeat